MYAVKHHADKIYVSEDSREHIERTCQCGDSDSILFEFEPGKALDALVAFAKDDSRYYRKEEDVFELAQLFLKNELITFEQYRQLNEEFKWDEKDFVI